MRIWSLHPRYLDSRGLVALWREALLAEAVLRGKTVGYRNHPEVARFQGHPRPVAAIACYLRAVYRESIARGYRFDRSKLRRCLLPVPGILVTRARVEFEWSHLKDKLKRRAPAKWRELLQTQEPKLHPLFVLERVDRECSLRKVVR